MNIKKYLSAGLLGFASLFSYYASATVVEVRTVQGNFQINLFDETTPQSVANFLSYVNSGAYANNVVHRSDNGFIIQMGGFQYNNSFPPDTVPSGIAVNNEPILSNVRGTVAYAKLNGNPNSATSQFFINLGNNASNLDTQNGGFTVFGQVIGDGMQVVDNIASLPTFGFNQPFNELPLRDYTTTDFNSTTLPNDTNLVIISDVVVVDATPVTNPDLDPAPNTLINSGGSGQPSNGGNSSSSGGAVNFILVLMLTLVIAVRRKARLLN